MHVHALCVCYKIKKRTSNHCRVGEAGNFSKDIANWKALYTTRGLCECVSNSLTRAAGVEYCHGRRKITATMEFPGSIR